MQAKKQELAWDIAHPLHEELPRMSHRQPSDKLPGGSFYNIKFLIEYTECTEEGATSLISLQNAM
ncbi:MAG: hypothetical protein IJ158_00545 [Treponema sp.]|nr:hypothetical protein [Treponema sp.]